MKRSYFLTLIIFLILAAIIVRSEEIKAETITLDIESAVSLALQNNLDLKASHIDFKTKKRATQYSWNEFLPSINVGAGLTHSEGYRTSSISPSSPWDMSGSISASLPLSAANAYSITNNQLVYEVEKISLEETEKLLELDVKEYFYNLIVLKEKIKLIKQNIDTAQKRYDQAKINYESGLVSELTMLSAQVTLENLKPELEELKVSYETSEMQFKQILGLDKDVTLSITGSIEPKYLALKAKTLIPKYLPTRLDVQSLEKTVQVLENKKKLTQAEEYTPVLSLSYSFKAQIDNPFQSNWGSPDSWSDTSTFGISLSLPLDGLIPGSSSRMKVKEIDDSIEKTRIELTMTRQLAEVEIESIVMRLDKSLRTLKVLEQNVTLAQKTYDLTEKQYNAGVVGLLEVEEAFDALQETKLGVLEERYNYLTGLFDLEYALNNKLGI
ncbi:MAG: TolC family protein [Spirochaetota bacterium]|nr:MAG: TolC family protein [Spirochaetota bacterium]